MSVQGISYDAAEFVIDACGRPIGGHEGDVHFHFLFRVAVFGLFIPGVFVFSFGGGTGVELVGLKEDCEGYF